MADRGAEKVIVRHPHGEGSIPDYHEAVWLGDSVVRDRAGRSHKHAFTRFAVVICNNPGCPFKALVNAEVVAWEAERG